MNKTKIRCSSLGRLFNCPFSMKLPSYETESAYATQGTVEHELAEAYLKGNETLEMASNTRTYCDFVNLIKKTYTDYHIEKRLNINLGDNHILSGCPDFYAIKYNKAWIVDLKTGYMEINPESSHQLKGYALLISKYYNIDTFSLSIVQDNEPKTFEIKADEIAFFEQQLIAKLDDYTHKRGDHCIFCPSKIHCKLQYDLVDALKQEEFEAYYYDIVKNKSILKKTIDEIDDNLRLQSPQLYEKYTKRYKKWINEDEAPYKKTIMRPSEALRQDKVNATNIYTVEKIYWRLKDL